MSKFNQNNSRASKLSPVQVHEIRSKYAAGYTQASLCREYGISIGQIGRIVRGESWQQFPVARTENQVQADYLRQHGSPPPEPTEEEIAASAAKLDALVAAEEERIDPIELLNRHRTTPYVSRRPVSEMLEELSTLETKDDSSQNTID